MSQRVGSTLTGSCCIPAPSMAAALFAACRITPAQTERVMENLSAILAAAGTSFAQAVKTTVYLLDMSEFAAMNEVYGTYFPAPAPARATVQAARLPRDVRVEIDLVAYVAES